VSLAFPSSPSGRLIHFLDIVLVVWIAGWVVLGLWVGREVRGLTQLSDTVQTAGVTLDQAGRQLDTLKGLPFVGNRIHEVGQQLGQAAASAIQSGKSSRGHIESLSVLLAVAVGAAPTLPLLALFVPLRRARIREVRAVRKGLREAAAGTPFDEFLAHRAAERLPYDALRRVSGDPWADLASGRYEALANAELKRIGIRRPRAKGTNARSVASRA